MLIKLSNSNGEYWSPEDSYAVQTVQYVVLMIWLDLTYIFMSCVSEIKGAMELSKKMRLKLGATSEPVKPTEKPSVGLVKDEPVKPAEKTSARPVTEEPVKPVEKPSAGPVKDEPVKPLEKPSAEPVKDEPVKPTELTPAGENNQVPGVGQTTISPNNAGADSTVKNDNSDTQQ